MSSTDNCYLFDHFVFRPDAFERQRRVGIHEASRPVWMAFTLWCVATVKLTRLNLGGLCATSLQPVLSAFKIGQKFADIGLQPLTHNTSGFRCASAALSARQALDRKY